MNRLGRDRPRGDGTLAKSALGCLGGRDEAGVRKRRLAGSAVCKVGRDCDIAEGADGDRERVSAPTSAASDESAGSGRFTAR